MATINYADKVALDINPDIADINKVNASDMNLLKQVGNQTLKTIGVFTDDWSSSATYAVKDIVIYDNRVFENLTGNNTATPPDQDTTNWEETTIAKLSAGVNIPIQDTAPDNPEEDDLWIDTSESAGGSNILDTIFPVGSIIIKADNSDYSNWLGFTWERTLVGRVAVGIDTTQGEFDTIGETGGEKYHTLTTSEIPSHNHMSKIYSKNYNDNKSLSGNRAYARSFADVVGGWNYTVNGETGGQIVDTIETGNSGGGQGHLNLQPYQVVAYWKRTA